MEHFGLRFGWGSRPQTLGQCAQHLKDVTTALSATDQVFSTWRRTGTDSEASRAPLSIEDLKRWLAQGVAKRDINDEIISELGFSTSLYTVEDDSAIPLRVNCGVHSKWVDNTFSIVFPNEGPIARRLIKASVFTAIAKAVIQSWDPDYGVITSRESSEVLSPTGPKTEAGWVTFVSERHFAFNRARELSKSEPVKGGVVILATSGLFSSTNPNHMSAVREVAGLLKS